jgi:hypothetical protein
MKTLLIALTALLVAQVVHLLNRPEWFSVDATDDNFGLSADDLTKDLW